MTNTLKFNFSTKSDWNMTDKLLERICKAYKTSSISYIQPDGSMWGDIDDMKKDIHDALVDADKPKLRNLLSDPARTNLYFGMDTLAKHNAPHMVKGNPFLGLIDSIILDTLTNTLEVSGAHRFWNVERQPDRPPLDIEIAIVDLSRALGFDVTFPNPFPNEYGLNSSRGIIGHRVPTAIYHALKARELCELTDGGNVLEIGAGVGRTAYFANKMGIKNYTIVDIPMSLIGQATFLSGALGDDAIWLEGEDQNECAGKIRLISPPKLMSLSENFAVALNIDSLTEMPHDQSMDYFKYLLEHVLVLYSMNHEGNPDKTSDIASLAGVATRPIRFPSAFREGYVEELYMLRKPKWKRRQHYLKNLYYYLRSNLC